MQAKILAKASGSLTAETTDRAQSSTRITMYGTDSDALTSPVGSLRDWQRISVVVFARDWIIWFTAAEVEM